MTALVVADRVDVLQVPSAALFRRGEGWAVFAVEDGRVRLRPVRTGASGASGAAVEVLDGLEPGTLVVLHPGERLVDGARVQAVGPDR